MHRKAIANGDTDWALVFGDQIPSRSLVRTTEEVDERHCGCLPRGNDCRARIIRAFTIPIGTEIKCGSAADVFQLGSELQRRLSLYGFGLDFEVECEHGECVALD